MGNVYVFSLFVFFLVALLMVLFFVLLRIFNQRGLELEKKKLVRLYESLEQDVNEYKNFVAATREKMEQDMHRFLRRIETSRQQEEGLTLKNIKKLIDQPGEELKKQSQPGKDAGGGGAGPQEADSGLCFQGAFSSSDRAEIRRFPVRSRACFRAERYDLTGNGADTV